MLAKTEDLNKCPVGGTDYWFRTPDIYDPAQARRFLRLKRVRRPAPVEFRVAALAGVEALAEATGDIEEGEHQRGLLERYYALCVATDENDIDEPDQDLRKAELDRLEALRLAELESVWLKVSAIEANLERHWQPYAELLADREFWDDVSRIEIVRLLLVRQGAGMLARDEDGRLSEAAYAAIPKGHRTALATFAFGLLAPDETQRKN